MVPFIVSLIITIGVFVIIGKMILNVFAPGLFNPKMLCLKCHHNGKVKTVTPGSILIEIILWICLILPGIIYSLWRVSKKAKLCAMCDSSDVVPLGSPKAKEILSKMAVVLVAVLFVGCAINKLNFLTLLL